MGQTLTHGVYLPDEGERNCYSGLAANWGILDGAVGTVAEHSNQISGKAPLVHTHVKADITDFPALANVATSGSYNDLSNIPASFTPSSHTHGNLTNDGKVGTTANVPLITGTDGVVQAGSFGNAANTFCEGNDSRLSDARTPVAHTHVTADVTDLLNSAHTWSAENTYTNILLTLKHTALEVGVLPASNQTKRYRFTDKNNADLGWLQHRVNTSGDSYLEIYAVNKFSNGQFSPQGSDVANSLIVGLHSDGTRYARIMSDFVPAYTNLCNLGTSTNKWKTLNGINPGALSLPVTALNNTYDISGNITDLTGGNNTITAARTGWVFVKSDNATEISIENTTTGMGASDHSASATTLMVSIPVTSGEKLNIIANCTSIDKAYLLPCQGNV